MNHNEILALVQLIHGREAANALRSCPSQLTIALASLSKEFLHEKLEQTREKRQGPRKGYKW